MHIWRLVGCSPVYRRSDVFCPYNSHMTSQTILCTFRKYEGDRHDLIAPILCMFNTRKTRASLFMPGVSLFY